VEFSRIQAVHDEVERHHLNQIIMGIHRTSLEIRNPLFEKCFPSYDGT
jgi:hypothetical protein